jgi:hypothetical protein
LGVLAKAILSLMELILKVRAQNRFLLLMEQGSALLILA